MTKRCSKCGEVKHPDDFCSNKKWLSRVTWCKQCQAEAARQRRANLDDNGKRAEAARAAAYRKDNPWVSRAKTMNSRVRKAGITGHISGKELEAIWIAGNGKCWICGVAADEFDHFRPINTTGGNGKHQASNIRPICHECNYKRDRVWRGEEKANKEAVLLCQLKQMLHG